jgi:hypothetical protein
MQQFAYHSGFAWRAEWSGTIFDGIGGASSRLCPREKEKAGPLNRFRTYTNVPTLNRLRRVIGLWAAP